MGTAEARNAAPVPLLAQPLDSDQGMKWRVQSREETLHRGRASRLRNPRLPLRARAQRAGGIRRSSSKRRAQLRNDLLSRKAFFRAAAHLVIPSFGLVHPGAGDVVVLGFPLSLKAAERPLH